MRIQVSPRDPITKLHAEIDREVDRLSRIHVGRMACRPGCAGCCVDDLRVHPAEAARIRAEYPAVLEEAPAPEGACAFLDQAGCCRVYSARPYVCRTQGLPIRWFAGEPVAEYRDICPLNEAGPAITELGATECWLIGPTEASLAALPSADERVPLRALFK